VLTVAAPNGGQTTGPAEEAARSPRVKLPPADNSRCLVCHINFEEEFLAVKHARKGYGCVYCHGESAAHSADEDNVTPPDKMYARAKINAACTHCHKPEKLIAKEKKHEPVLAGTATRDKYCTDCHGEHLMSHRTKCWDKETGKLLPTPKKKETPTKKK
jgi:hypothetical protein